MNPNEKTAHPKRVLVTGAAGAVGRVVSGALRNRGHFVRGFDLHASPAADESLVGDLAKAGDVDDAVQGMDTVVHLGATPDEADFLTQLLPNNIVGVFHVFDAARRFGVKRVVGASTLQTVRGYDLKKQRVRLEDGFRTTNHYGATKVFLEALGSTYAHAHQISFIGARLGWFPRTPESTRWGFGPDRATARLAYLSHEDAKRFFVSAVEIEDIRYALAFVSSIPEGNDEQGMDPEPARRLGFVAQDRFPEGLPWRFDAEGQLVSLSP